MTNQVTKERKDLVMLEPGVYQYVGEPSRLERWFIKTDLKLTLLFAGDFQTLSMLRISEQVGSGKITKEQAREKIEKL